jgi:hypothetical protein
VQDGVVDIRLLYFDDCPNWRTAEQRLSTALGRLGDPSVVVGELVDTPEKAERLGFRGSPTILINGSDPFADPDAPVGLSCRIYRSAAGLEPAPTVEELESALADAR